MSTLFGARPARTEISDCEKAAGISYPVRITHCVRGGPAIREHDCVIELSAAKAPKRNRDAMATADLSRPSTLVALFRGALGRCPRCGRGPLLHRYLKMVDRCPACGEPYGHFRTDDAAPWLTILVVGHLTVPVILIVEDELSASDRTCTRDLFAADRRTDIAFLAALQGNYGGPVVGDEGGRFRKDLRLRARRPDCCDQVKSISESIPSRRRRGRAAAEE